MKVTAGKSDKRIIIGAIAVLVASIAVYLYFSTGPFRQISDTEAQRECDKLFQEVKAHITAVPGYSVINGDKRCDGTLDEAGSADYYFYAQFRVAKGAPTSVDEVKANMNYLSNKLPRKDYSASIDNIPASNGQPHTICVTARRDLNNDGEYIEQNYSGHARYTEPSSVEMLCALR